MQLGLVREAQGSERKRKRVRMICRYPHAEGCSLTHVRVAGRGNETEMRQEDGSERRLRGKVERGINSATTRRRRRRRRRGRKKKKTRTTRTTTMRRMRRMMIVMIVATGAMTIRRTRTMTKIRMRAKWKETPLWSRAERHVKLVELLRIWHREGGWSSTGGT